MTLTVFTIGYEQHGTPDDLVAALRAANIERLVDVRERPVSRKRGFSKSALDDALASAAIAYEHVRELGNPKQHRDLYKAGRLEAGRDAYRAHLHNGSHDALVALAESLGTGRTCLLCVEQFHEACHRSVIAEGLKDRVPGLQVVHL